VARTTCLLCGVALEALDHGRQKHPQVDDCEVRLTDAWGVAVPEEPTEGKLEEPEALDLKTYPFVDEVLAEIYAKEGLRRLGGVSSGRGWSSVSTFQRCPYAWNRRYRAKKKPWFLIESPALAIGTLIHTFLASHYEQMIDPEYPLSAATIYEVTKHFANPEFVEEAWRVFSAYRMYYSLEVIQPLAIEYDLKDPRTGESCRFDLIAYFPETIADRRAGTYILEHKSTSRFDSDTVEGWGNDGEVIGQVALWKRLGMDLRFGPLRGVIINLLGKHKVPQFVRTLVAPESWQIDAHLDDLKRWEGLIQLATSSNSFPRARSGCIGRYGRCDYFDHCATGEDP
jgi:PD-(D/E)XK nuclease superfamily